MTVYYINMSVKELIEQLKALPNHEKGEVMDWLEAWELEQDAKLAELSRHAEGEDVPLEVFAKRLGL